MIIVLIHIIIYQKREQVEKKIKFSLKIGSRVTISYAIVNIIICDESCHDCDARDNTISIDKKNCLSCTSEYSLKENTNECYNEITKPLDYGFDEVSNTYKPCHNRCKECIIIGNNTNNKCFKCNNGYYTVEDNPGQCLLETEIN